MKFKKFEPLARFLKEKHYVDHVPYITVGIISSLACIAYAKFFSSFEKLGMKLFQLNPGWFFFFSPVFMVISFLLVHKFAPGATGSGIPQVMTCIEKSHNHLSSYFLGIRVLMVKVASSCLGIFSGAAIGREGPSLQISAVIAHKLGKVFKRLDIPYKADQMLIAGAASGLAAAFNTPIGGIVYAVEELAHEHMRSFKDVLLLSVVISGFTAQLILGNYLFLGYPEVTATMNLTNIAIISVISLLCGVLGSLFSIFLATFIKWRASKSFRQQLMIVILVSVSLVAAYIFFGPRSVFSGKDSINYILFSHGEIPATEALFRFLSSMLSSMTGIAGGIFAPSLSTGAAIGGFTSQFFDPSLRIILALSGMVGFLTGVTRSPITSFVLVLEMTDRHSSVLAMMLAAFFSSLGGHIIGQKSFYEMIVESIKNDPKHQNLPIRK